MITTLLQSFSDFAITIVEALGPDSRLIVEGASGTRTLYMGVAFEWITLVAVLIYLFFGVRYYNYIRYVMLSIFGVKLIERKGSHLSRGEQNNYLAIMIGLGLLLSTMAASKAAAVYAPQMLMEGISATSAYAVLAVAIALFVGVIFGSYVVVLLVAGFISEQQVLCKMLLRCRLQNMALAFTVAIPLLVLYLVAVQFSATVIVTGLVIVAILAEMISIKDTFFCFKQQKVSILHWFLYLCAVELLPISFIVIKAIRW